MKIVVRSQNLLSSQDEPTQMLRGEVSSHKISHSNLQLVE